MKKQANSTPDSVVRKIQRFIEETDIHILVFAPPVLAALVIAVWLLIMIPLTNGHIYQPLNYFVLGVSSLFMTFSGFAQVYKKEMPGNFGKVVKGKIAVASGLILTTFAAIISMIMFASSLGILK